MSPTSSLLLKNLARCSSSRIVSNRRGFASKAEQQEKFLNTRHLRLQNGEKAPLLFSPGEYERRLTNLRWLNSWWYSLEQFLLIEIWCKKRTLVQQCLHPSTTSPTFLTMSTAQWDVLMPWWLQKTLRPQCLPWSMVVNRGEGIIKKISYKIGWSWSFFLKQYFPHCYFGT